MNEALERYRLYLDECGDHVFHDESALALPGHRFLALVGCWFPQGSTYSTFQRALEDLKQRYFPHSPDEPLILHRKELIEGRGRFWRLRNPETRRSFNEDLCKLLDEMNFIIVGVCVDKLKLKQQYPQPFHPYHMGLGFLLQRYCGWLNHFNRQGDLMAESRGAVEDGLLRNAYEHTWQHGDFFHKADFFRRALTSKDAKLKRKSENIAGLQLADLLAHAVRDDTLRENQLLTTDISPFDARLLAIAQGKYNKQLYTGRIEGYGRIMFPK